MFPSVGSSLAGRKPVGPIEPATKRSSPAALRAISAALRLISTVWSASPHSSSFRRERLYLATGLLLPVWDKLPAEHVRVSRIASSDGRSLLGREVPVAFVPDLCRELGIGDVQQLDPDQLVDAVLGSGKPMEIAGIERLTLKRSLVNGSQRLELAGWSAARLDWYKAQGCFTGIIRYKTRLFVPRESATDIVDAICKSAG